MSTKMSGCRGFFPGSARSFPYTAMLCRLFCITKMFLPPNWHRSKATKSSKHASFPFIAMGYRLFTALEHPAAELATEASTGQDAFRAPAPRHSGHKNTVDHFEMAYGFYVCYNPNKSACVPERTSVRTSTSLSIR